MIFDKRDPVLLEMVDERKAIAICAVAALGLVGMLFVVLIR